MGEVLGQQLFTLEEPGRLDDGSIPVGQPVTAPELERAPQQRQRRLLDREAQPRLDEQRCLLVRQAGDGLLPDGVAGLVELRLLLVHPLLEVLGRLRW